MTRVNRISAIRPPIAISRMPEQEVAFLKEQMRQRAEIEERRRREQEQKPPEPPTPEEKAQRRAERVMDGSARKAAIRPNDPTATPVLSIADLFAKAKTAGLRTDEIDAIQVRLKQLRGQDRTRELRFLQEKVLPARNWAQALRIYTEISSLSARYPERLTTEIIQALTAGIVERPSGKQKIPAVVLHHQDALDVILLIMQLNAKEFEQLCGLLNEASLRSGQKVRNAEPEVERAFILKAAALRSNLFTNPDPLNKLRSIVGIPNEAMHEVEVFASRIRGIPANDLIDFANKPVTLAPDQNAVTESKSEIVTSNYLAQGFFDADGSFKNELIRSWSQSTALRFVEEGIQTKEIAEIVNQLSHVALQFDKRFENALEEKLDAPTLAAIKLILEPEELSQFPSFWELTDSARKWLIDLRSLGAFTLHLDSIRSWM
jgi:hypothetical protein